jgi:hypothetical protein
MTMLAIGYVAGLVTGVLAIALSQAASEGEGSDDA